jgi:tRNA (adenine37-N6)-methyltransferase
MEVPNHSNTSILYRPIGIIHTPLKDPKGTPIQPAGGSDISATIEIFPEYADGLKDIEGFSHLILIYHMHLVKKSPLRVTPFLDQAEHGIFATRAPVRPNPVGLSIVKLEKVEGTLLYVKDIDMLDGSPLLDIKPFVPIFDARDAVKTGWFGNNIKDISKIKNDGRFD